MMFSAVLVGQFSLFKRRLRLYFFGWETPVWDGDHRPEKNDELIGQSSANVIEDDQPIEFN